MAGSMVVRVQDDINDIDPTSICRSVCVTGFQAGTKSEDLIIHFQRKKNGGGDIDTIIVSKKGAAVITFDDPKVVSSVIEHKQTFEGVVLTVERYLDTMVKNGQQLEVFEVVSAELCLEFVEHLSRDKIKVLLKEIEDKTGVKWIESSENFILSGTFKQLEESRAYLQQDVNQSYGIVVFNDLRRKEAPFQGCESESSPRYDEAETQEDVDQNRPATTAENEVVHPPERINDKTNTDRKVSSTSFEIQSFEIEPKIVKVFVKAHDKELEEIETTYHVEIPRKAEEKKLCLKPKDQCSADDYEEACNKFISLYQKMYQLIKMERFSLKSEVKVVTARGVIGNISKKFPVSVEKSKDHSNWELYGEASHIEEALKYLQQEGVEIKRENEGAMDEKGGRKKLKDDDIEAMDIDPPKYSRDVNNSENRLETYIGKVKVSVYQGDITSEHVDVIVNAANKDLDHIGGVAKSILDKGGKVIQKESKTIIKQRAGRTLRDGEAVATTSGNLPCKMVVHAVGPKWHDVGPLNGKKLLREACLNSFGESQKLKMTSIALPAISSGVFGMPKNVCAEVMFDAMEEFVRKGDPKKKTVTDIRFVNIDDSSVQAFTREFVSRYGDNLATEKRSGGGSDRLSSTGAEGGNSTAPPLRSNRGRNQRGKSSKNSRLTTSRSSAASKDHPLSDSGHSPSPATSYSGAVKRNANEKDGRPPTEGKGAEADKADEETCAICLDAMTNPRALKCKHTFCSECLQKALDVCKKCPVCQEIQGVLQGTQPRGDMTSRFERYSSIPGYEGCGAIIIDYFFPSGVQGPEHPSPGKYYDGTSRTAYLPNTREGRDVLHLLRRAFDARLVFTIGTSNTTGRSNQVIWNDIHHKTNIYGGPYGFGYPDPDYLRRVKEELAAKGIR